jgi:hypothetical protein
MKTVIILCIVLLAFIGVCYGANPIPRMTFINITEEILDALDELEATLSNSPTVRDANVSLTKLDARLKKYDRYVPGKWPPGSQKNIAESLSLSAFAYRVYIVTNGMSIKSKNDGEKEGTKAREFFQKYKSSKF